MGFYSPLTEYGTTGESSGFDVAAPFNPTEDVMNAGGKGSQVRIRVADTISDMAQVIGYDFPYEPFLQMNTAQHQQAQREFSQALRTWAGMNSDWTVGLQNPTKPIKDKMVAGVNNSRVRQAPTLFALRPLSAFNPAPVANGNGNGGNGGNGNGVTVPGDLSTGAKIGLGVAGALGVGLLIRLVRR